MTSGVSLNRSLSIEDECYASPAGPAFLNHEIAALKEAIVKEVYDTHKVVVPHSEINVKTEVDRDRAHFRTNVAIRASVHAWTIDNLILAYHPMMIVDDVAKPKPYFDVQVLEAMLDEVLPNWKEIYAHIKRQELSDAERGHYTITPVYGGKLFKPEWPASIARSDTDSSAKDKWILDRVRGVKPSYDRAKTVDAHSLKTPAPLEISATHWDEAADESSAVNSPSEAT